MQIISELEVEETTLILKISRKSGIFKDEQGSPASQSVFPTELRINEKGKSKLQVRFLSVCPVSKVWFDYPGTPFPRIIWITASWAGFSLSSLRSNWFRSEYSLQEYRRYLEEYNVYSVLTVQTKLHTTLDKTSTDKTRSCVLADVVVLGKTPRILMRRNPSKKVKSLRELLKLMTSSQLY